MTGLKDKTVAELFTWAHQENYDAAKDDDNGYNDIAVEMARRLEEAQKQIEHVTCPQGHSTESRETRSLCSYGTCYGCTVDRLHEAQIQNAAHDAETAAKALEEAGNEIVIWALKTGFMQPYTVKALLLEMAAEYRAKAKGEKP